MTIAYICCDFGVPVFGFKGASIHVREMIEAFRRGGHRVILISPAMAIGEGEGRNLFQNSDALPEVTLHPLAAEGFHLQIFKEFEALDKFLGTKTRIRQEARNLLYNLTVYQECLECLRERQVDFVYERYTLFSHAGIRIARELKVPHLLEVNAPLAYEQEKMRGLEMKELARDSERRIWVDTGHLFVVSSELLNYVVQCGVPDERISVLPNSVDPARFQVSEDQAVGLRRRLGLKNECLIGFVGSLKPWHGTETLLEAFHRLHDVRRQARLLIVGDGPGREGLENYVQAHGLQEVVTFAGKVDHAEIPAYLAAMDITVAPYIPSENFYFSPIKIFEYMIMGKPVVAGKIGQIEEIVLDGETGRLFAPGNVGELASVLRDLVNKPKERKRLGVQGRNWVKRERTWDNNAGQVIEIAKGLKGAKD